LITEKCDCEKEIISMKRYNIVVNGTSYAVDVEEAGTSPATPVAPVVQVPVPVAAPPVVPQEVKAAPIEPSVGAQSITSPMPGTILDIRVSQGQQVNTGDILLILEAMKMENEILAPKGGTVDTIQIGKGASVNSGDLLMTLK
jgi:biotin carboxyl carrier protein